jgi:hypothetical protein
MQDSNKSLNFIPLNEGIDQADSQYEDQDEDYCQVDEDSDEPESAKKLLQKNLQD